MDNKKKTGVFSGIRIGRITWNHLLQWICNPQMIIIICLMLFIQNYVVDGMIENATKMGEQLQIFEVFIAVANSSELCVAIPAVFLLLIGDFPSVDGTTMLYIYRSGRYNWFFGQIVSAILSAGIYIFVILGGCIILSGTRVQIGNQWSNVTTKYLTLYPNDIKNSVAKLITGRQYNNFSPYEAAGYAFTLMFLFLVLLSMIKLVFFLYGKSTAGVALGGLLIGSGWTLNLLDTKLKWLFPMAHVIEWQHCDEIFRTMEVSMGQSYIYFLVIIMVLLILGIMQVDQYNFGYGKQ